MESGTTLHFLLTVILALQLLSTMTNTYLVSVFIRLRADTLELFLLSLHSKAISFPPIKILKYKIFISNIKTTKIKRGKQLPVNILRARASQTCIKKPAAEDVYTQSES